MISELVSGSWDCNIINKVYMKQGLLTLA